MTLPFDPNDPFLGIETRARLKEGDPGVAGLEARLRAIDESPQPPTRATRPNLLRRLLRIIRGDGD